MTLGIHPLHVLPRRRYQISRIDGLPEIFQRRHAHPHRPVELPYPEGCTSQENSHSLVAFRDIKKTIDGRSFRLRKRLIYYCFNFSR